MKELSIEQKAKAYDEAKARMSRAFNSNRCTIGFMNEIFPELKESEDEQIRKELIQYFSTFTLETFAGLNPKKIIAWLEKQGKPEAQGKSALEASNEEKVDNQNCVKPTDKVEHKFKVGDWLTNGLNIRKIIALGTGLYVMERENGTEVLLSVNYVEKNYHLWTIEDAKDGDILAFDDETIVIFKDLYNTTTFHSYCHVEEGAFSASQDDMPDWWEGEGFHPATKKQCDLLFRKMKGVGYEWDAKKKELKKIEDEEYNGEDYGIDSLYHAQRILEKTLGKVDGYQSDDGILAHKCAITAVKKLYSQKPNWSEEDEAMVEALNNYVKNLDILFSEIKIDDKNILSKEFREKVQSWLKSLRIQNRYKPGEK